MILASGNGLDELPMDRGARARLIRAGRGFADRSRRLPLSDAELLAAAADLIRART
jgi:hypothetical protein